MGSGQKKGRETPSQLVRHHDPNTTPAPRRPPFGVCSKRQLGSAQDLVGVEGEPGRARGQPARPAGREVAQVRHHQRPIRQAPAIWWSCQRAVHFVERLESAYGYELPWTGIVKAMPSPPQLHALITPPELLHLTQTGHPGRPTLRTRRRRAPNRCRRPGEGFAALERWLGEHGALFLILATRPRNQSLV